MPRPFFTLIAVLVLAGGLTISGAGPHSLVSPEPNFYILGAKSYGRNSQFLIAAGLVQIRDLFTLLGDRADLDLYESVTLG